MPNDAKFGLLVGVTMVIAVAVIFFRSEPGGPKASDPSSHAVKPLTLPAVPALDSATTEENTQPE